jgi:CRISP-associated protein Cas1
MSNASDRYIRFLSLTNFQLAWAEVSGNNGCAGVDGETIGHFALNVDRYLVELCRAVASKTYRPLPLRQILIPKKDGSWRKLGVPTVRDRIVQQALLNVLHPVLEPQFEPCSFAYRPGRSHLAAVRQVEQWRDRGYDWVLDGDIVQFFDRLDRERLLAEVTERMDEPRFLALLRGWISAPVLTAAGLEMTQCGIPQGAVISPILANVYLDDLDELLTQAGLKLVRYADDFLVLARSQARTVQARQEVAEWLTGIGLELHPEKTQITTFDRGFRFLGHAFAGDVVVPVQRHKPVPNAPLHRSELRIVHADPAVGPTVMQQALVEALQTAQRPIPPPLFVVLGYAVQLPAKGAIASKETQWKPDMSALYLVQQGSTIRKEQGRFLIQHPKEPEDEIPIREVEQILVFGNIQLTTSVITTCLELQIPVVYLSQMGEYKGHLWSAEATDLVLETAQFRRQGEAEWQRAMARTITQGKLGNSKELLLRLNRKRQIESVAETITALDGDRAAVGKLENTPMIDSIRGYEGAGAARYFAALNQLIVNPGFALTKREFHPPTDPMNSLLSFGYTLLYNNVFSLLLVEGLNPYLGNLHGTERQRADLACDLMEEFRSPVVDTMVMKLVNKKILSPTDFTYPNESGGVYLEEPGRRIFLKHFDARISEQTSHPDVQSPVSYRRAIQLQVKRYARAVLGNAAYEPFQR